MKNLLIRKAKIKDVEEIFKLGSKSKEFFVAENTGGFWTLWQLKNIISSKDDICLVAVYKKK